MFKSTPTWGRKVRAVSSWKLDTSTTNNWSGAADSTAVESARPTFPTTGARFPAASSKAPINVTVVDLPSVPVTATIGARAIEAASSSSPESSMPGRDRRLRERMVDRHSRREHDQIHAADPRGGFSAQPHLTPAGRNRCHLSGLERVQAPVDEHYAVAATEEQLGRREPAPCRADNEHSPPGAWGVRLASGSGHRCLDHALLMPRVLTRLTAT